NIALSCKAPANPLGGERAMEKCGGFVQIGKQFTRQLGQFATPYSSLDAFYDKQAHKKCSSPVQLKPLGASITPPEPPQGPGCETSPRCSGAHAGPRPPHGGTHHSKRPPDAHRGGQPPPAAEYPQGCFRPAADRAAARRG